MLQIDYSPPSGPSGHESQTWRSLKYRDSRHQVVPWCCAGLIALMYGLTASWEKKYMIC